jgi:steroid 5-alpha reductase family enzyme
MLALLVCSLAFAAPRAPIGAQRGWQGARVSAPPITTAPRARLPTRHASSAPTMVVVDVQGLVLASVVPSLLGLWKREYTVSYGYGGAMLGAGLLFLRNGARASPISLLHSLLYVAYGSRLMLFLLYREAMIPYFRELRERVETRAPTGSRLNRLPFCLSCGLLYFCMAAPLALTAGCAAGAASRGVEPLLGLAYIGWAVASLGDAQKSMAKSRGEGLVTTGLFRWLRHPNYTGEAGLWVGSTLAGIAAAAATVAGGGLSLSLLGWLVASLIGCAGIELVLAQATAGLEKRQLEKYGLLSEYTHWTRRAWTGPVLRAPAQPQPSIEED